MKFVYSVWFQDASVPFDDEDYEWPACFVIIAANGAAAKVWGDRLARRYASSRSLVLLSSSIEEFYTATLEGIERLAEVTDGNEAQDFEIGW